MEASNMPRILLNTYSTLRELPLKDFPHVLHGERDRSDPELSEHLDGFRGYVWSRGKEEMSANKYHLLQHIGRTRVHSSLELDTADLDAFAGWAWEANAILFLEDGTLRDPSGGLLIGADGSGPGEDAMLPYPEDAEARKEWAMGLLSENGFKVTDGLPPVPGEGEVQVRTAEEVASRLSALYIVCLRARSLALGEEGIPAEELEPISPAAASALSPAESAFLTNPAPGKQDVIDFNWRYEAMNILAWALGLVEEVSFPSGVCDVEALQKDAASILDGRTPSATLRGAGELLDMLDLHYRLHWVVRQARVEGKPVPEGIEPGVVQERHHALNWLLGFENEGVEWDDIDTPT